MNRYHIGTLILLALAVLMAAKPFVNPREDGAYARAGRGAWGQTEYVAAAGEFVSTTTAAISLSQAEDPTGLPKLFEYGTIVMVTCDQDALLFWTQDTATVTSTTGWITDSGSTSGRTSGANGLVAQSGVTRHTVVPQPSPSTATGYTLGLEEQVSVRKNVCIATGSSTTTSAVYGRPCDADADCFHSYSASCSSSNGSPKGSYLFINPTAAANCSVEVEH